MDSILTSIKKLLGIDEYCEHYDDDIIMHINTIFMVLTQLGIGPSNGFSIHDKYDLWDDFVEENPMTECLKTYIYLKVKMLFDPPTSSIVADAINRQIGELEWRLTIIGETKDESEDQNENN